MIRNVMRIKVITVYLNLTRNNGENINNERFGADT